MKYILIVFIAFFTTQTLADNFVLEMLNKRSDGQRMVFSEDITHVELAIQLHGYQLQQTIMFIF